MKKQNKLLPWIIWALASSFFFGHYIIRVAPSLIVNDLMLDLSINTTQFSLIISSFFLSYTFAQAPAGMLIDRYGPRILLSIATIAAGIATLIFSGTTSITAAYSARFIFGIGAAFSFVGAITIAKAWLEPKYLALAIGLTQTMGMLGSALSNNIMPNLIQSYGWRETLNTAALALITLGVLILFFVRNNPESNNLEKNNYEEEVVAKDNTAFKTVIACSRTWLVCFFCAFIFAPTAIIAEAYGVEYIKHVYDFSYQLSSSAIGFISVGWAIGGPILGSISNVIGRRKVMIISAIACSAFLTLLLYTEISASMLFILCTLYGIANSGLVAAYTMAGELHSKKGTALSLGMANMFTIILGFALVPLVGYSLDVFWSGLFSADGTRFYTSATYAKAFIFVPVLPLISAILAYYSKETYKPTIK